MTDPAAVPLHPDIARSIRASGTPLLERRDQFRDEFHASLVELLPEVPVMTQPAGAQITQSLVNCVLWAVFATEPPVVVGTTLQGVGLELHRLGFPRYGYQSVGHALLRTLRGLYPMDWSGEMSSSWIGYHAWLCEHWLRGADIGVMEEQARIAMGQGGYGQPAQPVVEENGDDEDDEDEGLSYGEIMVSMTLGGARSPRRLARRPDDDDEYD